LFYFIKVILHTFTVSLLYEARSKKCSLNLKAPAVIAFSPLKDLSVAFSHPWRKFIFIKDKPLPAG